MTAGHKNKYSLLQALPASKSGLRPQKDARSKPHSFRQAEGFSPLAVPSAAGH